jgi:hypothetical protein
MIDKKSPHYMKSELESIYYGKRNYTTHEKMLRIEGNDEGLVRDAAWSL